MFISGVWRTTEVSDLRWQSRNMSKLIVRTVWKRVSLIIQLAHIIIQLKVVFGKEWKRMDHSLRGVWRLGRSRAPGRMIGIDHKRLKAKQMNSEFWLQRTSLQVTIFSWTGYFFLAALSYRDSNAMTLSRPSTSVCNRALPMAKSDASHTTLEGRSESGIVKIGSWRKLSLSALKTSCSV